MNPGEILLYDPVAFPSSKQFDEICRRIDLQPELFRELLDADHMPCRSSTT